MCLWWYHQLEPWSFVVYAFNVQTIIRVFKTLIVYALQETDIHSSTSWLKLEDYVYLVRVSGALVITNDGVSLFYSQNSTRRNSCTVSDRHGCELIHIHDWDIHEGQELCYRLNTFFGVVRLLIH